ncbi:MAG TPA: Nif3-like dinuclear metal center hexameric protein [Abditibacteriaceae bacterium]|jgi:dinuclear metal center YbgI/SA1388 family protein
MATVRDLLKAIDARYPLARAEKWDKTGLLIGDAQAPVQRVLVAHEVTAQTIEEARGHEALVVYHPPIFRALENLDFKNHTARLAAQCIAQGLNVIAVHTALDGAPQPHALGDKLAEELGLQNMQVLKPSGYEPLFKIVVFVPPEALDKVSNAMWNAGAGNIGNYDRAAFRNKGTGTFRPLPGADPYDGEIGKQQEADEWRLEVIVPATQRDEVIRAMQAAHPYEEVAYDAYPLHNMAEPFGAARMGELQASTRLHDFAQQAAVNLRAPSLRLVDSGRDEVRKVACVPGAGASYIEAAARAGCDCLVSGDFKHHDALMAQAHGLSLIDVTHTATERAAIGMMADALGSLQDVEIVRSAIDTNPFQTQSE